MRVGALHVATSDKFENGVRRIVKGEKMQLERRIFGNYEKFNSNSGWSANKGLLMDFFSHWTYRHSGKRFLVCDLQGHKGVPGGPKWGNESNYYVLTDPAVISFDGRYGDTDLGSAGIANWFSQHTCNALCKKHGLDRVRPGQHLKKACRARTTFKFEFQFGSRPRRTGMCTGVRGSALEHGLRVSVADTRRRLFEWCTHWQMKTCSTVTLHSCAVC